MSEEPLSPAEQMMRQVETLLVRQDALVAATLQRQQTALDQLRAEQQKLREVEATFSTTSFEEQRKTVLAKVGRAAFDELTRREARIAARLHDDLPVPTMQRLLGERPDCHGAFVDQVFRAWDSLRAHPRGTQLIELVLGVSEPPRFLRRLRRETLLEGAADEIAAAGPRDSLRSVLAWLSGEELFPRWHFTSHVLARLVCAMMNARGADTVWRELGERPDVAVQVLPPLDRPHGQWFFANRPRETSGSLEARALVVGYLLHSFHLQRHPPPEALVTGLLDSELGDPRLPPLSAGWEAVQRRTPEGFRSLLETLIREDITLFFQHAMHEPARESFWRDYVKSIRRTICVMSEGNRALLAQRLRSAAPSVRSALQRVRAFGGSTRVNAFCLYFDSIVVVEFSETGNAGYIYDRFQFDTIIEPELRAGRVRNERDLKRAELRTAGIHHSGDWQTKAAEHLADEGVFRQR